MTLETVAPTWKHKLNVDDTVIFGGDIAANGSAASSWTNGAFSNHRAAALAIGDYLELDVTFDAKTNGHGIAIGLSPSDTDKAQNTIQSCFEWGTDQNLRVYQAGSLAVVVGAVALPMSIRVVYDAGVIKFYSNAGSDVLRYTSLRTVAQVYDEMFRGVSIDVSFFGTSGKLHATLKGGTSVTPEIPMDGSTGRLGLSTFEAVSMNMESYAGAMAMVRTLSAEGFPPPNLHPRPTEGKIWPRKQ